MNKTIVFSWKKEDHSLNEISKNRELFYTDSQKEAYLYHIEQAGIDSYIINCEDRSIVDIKAMIRHIHYLNAIITIILFKADYGVFQPLLSSGNIFIADDRKDIEAHLNEVSRKGRSSNRIQWPLRAEYWIGNGSDNNREKAMVTSISSGGCFLKTDSDTKNVGEHLSLLFHFRNFDFYADAIIVRTGEGMALEFKEVSPQTERYIQEIIDEKILSEIMQMIN